MKAIPLDFGLDEIDALRKKEQMEIDTDAAARLKKIMDKNTPPDGWPARTIEAANQAIAELPQERAGITPAMRRDAPKHATAITKTNPDP